MEIPKNPVDRFMYWMQERQRIFHRKEAGNDRPWTDDPILHEYKFTNVFRQQDRVTIELNNRYSIRDSMRTLAWKISMFRMFNWPETYDELVKHSMLTKWNERTAKKVLRKMKADKRQIFTGAYIITNSGSTRPKIELAAEALTELWNGLHTIVNEITRVNSLEYACLVLQRYPMMGKFTSYEVVTDMRHTKILNNATDIYTWANPGPGAKRGLNRIFRGHRGKKPAGGTQQYISEMQALMNDIKVIDKKRLEMRDIEHSLCEFDKYERVRLGEGRPRSKYHEKS